MEVIKGIPVAPGVVIGRAFVLEEVVERVPFHTVSPDEVAGELVRLDTALETASAALEADRDRAAEKLGAEPAKIFEFHLGLLKDRSLIDPLRARVEDDRVTAAYAVAEAFRALADRFRSMGSEVFRQKAQDVMDLDHRVLGQLVGQSRDRLARITEPVIVVAHDLTPAQAAQLDTSKVIGFAADAGGRTSHASIVAAAAGIPVVVGCQRITEFVSDGEEVIIDGRAGMVIVRPDAPTLTRFRHSMERMAGHATRIRELAKLPSHTTDGVRIELMGNIEFSHEIKLLLEHGGDGVGLFRTEFLYLTRATEPTEEDHFQEYKHSLELLAGRPLTIRTVDLGADKYTQERAEEPERNPMLGLRSIRFCLQNIPMFRTQLRAILRASAYGQIRVMFPLISTSMELRQTKMILADVMEECEEEGIEFDPNIPIGIMIEVPSAALMASAFAREVSFFSIGTNDLIQYTLAVDRGNERVANLYSAAHPAVVQLVKAVTRTSKRFQVETSICGEIAGEALYTMLLIGLGLRTLSLVPSQIPHVKRVIRSVDVPTCERLARKVGSFDSERQVLNCLREELEKVLPDIEDGWSVA
ncbi:MAG: phosphoenolpyruvate--protein phosphotransferase [Phycisphaerales bacterium]|nr:phosphoenolpyruvate--protein phosphotransferase [Phycisphaerae bacterium]NNF41577.1 phosphoenolpyruvate--protein phosphotransferase [Phycisphaerales bacterium]NNM24522.1 phosphoenolpyruvate--protein phosphotransferase [Phycisphaerales bacterium]